MISQNLVKAALFSALTAISNVSTAAIISGWGAEVSSTTSDNCPSYCTNYNEFAVDGGEGVSTAATGISNTTGITQAQSSLSGASFTPILQAYAASQLGTGAFADATGVQGYTYSGASRDISLNYALHSILDLSADASAAATVNAQIAVIFTDQLDFYTSFGTVVYEIAPPGSVVTSISLFSDATDSLTFTVNDGDNFFIWAGLQVTGKRGGSVDAFNTFTMNFDDDTGLLAATTVSAVPVPAAAWLFISGFGLIAGFARRR